MCHGRGAPLWSFYQMRRSVDAARRRGDEKAADRLISSWFDE
jgi:hypothetical protein